MQNLPFWHKPKCLFIPNSSCSAKNGPSLNQSNHFLHYLPNTGRLINIFFSSKSEADIVSTSHVFETSYSILCFFIRMNSESYSHRQKFPMKNFAGSSTSHILCQISLHKNLSCDNMKTNIESTFTMLTYYIFQLWYRSSGALMRPSSGSFTIDCLIFKK